MIFRRKRQSNNNPNHRDSLFDLPLYPSPPQEDGGIDIASQQLTADVNQRLASFSIEKARRQLTETSEDEWQSRGEKRALALFHTAAEHVPAYKDFLKKNKIKPDKIKSWLSLLAQNFNKNKAA